MSDLSGERQCTTGRTRSHARMSNNGAAVVGIVIGVLYLVLGVARGEALQGVIGLGTMVVYVALLLGLRRRSETAELLNGQASDERQAQVLTQASALTGRVLGFVLVGAFLVSLAAGSRYTLVLSGLAAVGGFTFVGATAWFSRHG